MIMPFPLLNLWATLSLPACTDVGLEKAYCFFLKFYARGLNRGFVFGAFPHFGHV